MKTLTITAKCSDLFGANVRDEQGNVLGTYDGYVPNWFPNPNEGHYGDYVQLQIDIESGKIVNWKKPTQAQLKETFKPHSRHV